MNPVNSASRAPTPIFNPKSPTYDDDLHKAGFISNAQLKASISGNRTDGENADKEVLDIASFISQRPLTGMQSEVIDSQFNSQQFERDKKLVANYEKKGYQFAHNSGKSNNCLIISILQHLTGNYKSNHDVAAAKYRTELDKKLKDGLNAKQKKAFQENAMLPPDHIDWLIKEMAKDKTLKNKSLTVELWMANAQGEPISFSIGNGKDNAIIFQRVNHFEAVIPPQKASDSSNAASKKPALAMTSDLAAAPVVATAATTATSEITQLASPASTDTGRTETKN